MRAEWDPSAGRVSRKQPRRNFALRSLVLVVVVLVSLSNQSMTPQLISYTTTSENVQNVTSQSMDDRVHNNLTIATPKKGSSIAIMKQIQMFNELQKLMDDRIHYNNAITSSGNVSTSINAEQIPTAFTIKPNFTFAWFQGGTMLETFHSFVPLPNNNGYQVVYKVNTQDTSIPSGRTQNMYTMQLSPNFERIESSRKELIVSNCSSTNHVGEVRVQSGLSDPRAFFWNNSVYTLTWRSWREDFENFLFNAITGDCFPLGQCIRG